MVEFKLVARRTMREGDVVVCDVVEEVDLFLLEEEAGGDGVDGSVTPPFVEEAAVLVQSVEEVSVGLGSEPIEVADLEIGPLAEQALV